MTLPPQFEVISLRVSPRIVDGISIVIFINGSIKHGLDAYMRSPIHLTAHSLNALASDL